ncbi:MAG: AtpZ/AtpI family protein [Betaproteobacteria bacterium]
MPPRSTPPETENPKGGDARDWTRGLREAAPLLGLGMTLAVTVLVGLGGGYWLDGRLGTRPLFLLVGASLGIVGALVYFVKTVGSTKGQSGR